MPAERIDRAVRHITREEPDRRDLEMVADSLRAADTDRAVIERYALASLVDSILAYLDRIQHGLEKSLGIKSTDERQRILEALSYPDQTDPQAQVADLIAQWESFDTYSEETVEQMLVQ